MADYLTKLAARALGVATIAQPAAPSLFAPEPPWAPPVQAGEATGLPVEAGLESSAALPRSHPLAANAAPSPLAQATAQPAPFHNAAPSPLAQVAAQPEPFHDATTLPQPARSRGSPALRDPVELWPSERPHAATDEDEPALVEVAEPAVDPGDLAPHWQRTFSGHPPGRTAGASPPEPAASPALPTSHPSSPAPHDIQPDEGAVVVISASPAALSGPSLAASSIELSALAPQRVASDDAGKSVVASAVAPVASSLTAPTTLQAVGDAAATQRAAPAASLLPQGQIDGASQASVPPAVLQPPRRDVEVGAAEPWVPAPDLLLPLESEPVSGNRDQLAAHRPTPSQTTPTPASIVEVTIGRVEVRAVQAAQPAAKPKAAPSAPALSLEAYLSQQQGSKP